MKSPFSNAVCREQTPPASATSIMRWHGVAPPNELAIGTLGDLDIIISAFEALRGQARLTDEPVLFDAVLLTVAKLNAGE